MLLYVCSIKAPDNKKSTNLKQNTFYIQLSCNSSLTYLSMQFKVQLLFCKCDYHTGVGLNRIGSAALVKNSHKSVVLERGQCLIESSISQMIG